MRRAALASLAILAGVGVAGTGLAQDTTAVGLSLVRVTVTREAARPALELPYAVTRLGVDETRAGTRRANLTELLLFVPGVTVVTRFNPSQDPRLSVRGFGARSAFGIRGVRVLRDGVPLTVADGQTAVDFLDTESLDAVEVFRGSAGALYGNSSGGVVDFRTSVPPDSGARLRLNSFYADGITRLSGQGGLRVGRLGAQATVSSNRGDGPRQYSDFRSMNYLGDVRWTAMGTQFQAQASYYDSPNAKNPGALTAAEMAADPTAADSLNILRKAHKSVQQMLLSLQASREGERASWTATVHGGTRDLHNPQSFAIVEFDRVTAGGTMRGEYRARLGSWPARFALGADLLRQEDDRINYFNCAGRSGAQRPPSNCPNLSDFGVVTLDQRERVTGLGAFARAELAPGARWSVTGTLRNDRTRFAVLDRRSSPPGPEATRTLSAVTPMVGVNWRVAPLASVYANVSSSFETPTSTELANQPDGSGGLNRELKPQRGTTYEAGVKGSLERGVRYDVALFTIETKDELIPFEVPGGGGRRFFRNAGRTRRTGAEASVGGDAGPVSLGATATWLRYEYDEYTVSDVDYAGKRVPGVAPHILAAFASLRPRWGLVALEAQRVGRLPADDANQTYVDAYTLLNARVALDLRGRYGAQPVVGVDNVFDKAYAANVVVNASGGRYFEPGPGRTLFVGVRVEGGGRRMGER